MSKYIVIMLVSLDITLYYFGISLLLIPLGVGYLISISYFISHRELLSFNEAKWLSFFLIVILLLQIVIIYLQQEASYNDGKILIRSLYPKYVSGALISIMIVLISSVFCNKLASLFVVVLSFLWLVSEPILNFQLGGGNITERINIYYYPIVSPLSDLLYYILMFVSLLSVFLIPAIILIGGWLIIYKKTLALERLSILLSMVLYVFYSANWGSLYFDV